jgi:hypothetical protein
MKVTVCQVYVKPGVTLPFSHHMQRRLAGELSTMLLPSSAFTTKYGADFSLVLNISAEAATSETRIAGPAVYRRTRDVEYTLFLPFDAICAAKDRCRFAMACILSAVAVVVSRVGIDGTLLAKRTPEVVARISEDPTMIDGDWPRGPMLH